MMIFKNNRKFESLYKDMREKLINDVYNEVGQKILNQSKKDQATIQAQLVKKLDEWDANIKVRIKEIIDENGDN